MNNDGLAVYLPLRVTRLHYSYITKDRTYIRHSKSLTLLEEEEVEPLALLIRYLLTYYRTQVLTPYGSTYYDVVLDAPKRICKPSSSI